MMSTITSAITNSPPVFVTAADVMASVGDVPAERIRVHPAPGTATEADLLKVNDDALRTAICELVEGTLVEKPMASFESILAMMIGTLLNQYVWAGDLGLVMGADGMVRLAPGLVRVPDVSFISWTQLPDRQLPREAIGGLHPDLAVEVLSASNTMREMQRKLTEYFAAGAQVVWYLDPQAQAMRVYRSETDVDVVDIEGTIDGGDLLPGFTLPLARLFEIVPPDAD